MENKFKKPTRLRGTPGHKLVNLYAAIGTVLCMGYGYIIIKNNPDFVENENSRYNKICKWFEDPEQDALRKKLNKQFMFPPATAEETKKTLEMMDN